MLLLDTNIFIKCHNYIPPDIFTSLWGWFDTNKFNTYSIESVFQEIDSNNKWLVAWAEDMRKKGFFIDSDVEEAQTQYKDVTDYIVNHYKKSKYRTQFLKGADPWLIAVALSRNWQILTFEKRAEKNSGKPKIPNVADHFGIKTFDFFEFLRNNKVTF